MLVGHRTIHRGARVGEENLGRPGAVQLGRPGAQPRDQLAAEIDRVLDGIEAPDQERVDAELVVFQYGAGDLLGCADEAGGCALISSRCTCLAETGQRDRCRSERVVDRRGKYEIEAVPAAPMPAPVTAPYVPQQEWQRSVDSHWRI